jgi:hypothetical protein
LLDRRDRFLRIDVLHVDRAAAVRLFGRVDDAAAIRKPVDAVEVDNRRRCGEVLVLPAPVGTIV